MAGDIEGLRDLNAYHLGYLFQVVVDVIDDIMVGASFVGAGILDDGQQIVSCVFGVLVKYHLHFLGPFDD